MCAKITIMAGPPKNFTESIISKVGEKLVDYGLERVTGNKDSKFMLETLQRSLNSLSDKACDINEQIRHGEQSGKKKRKREVENWLKEVTKIESELGVLQNEVQEEGFLSRFFGEDRVSKLQARVSELLVQSHHFGELLLACNEMKGEPLLTSRLVGEAFEKNAEVIWKWLLSGEVKSIGIYGMGGVGKTTLAKHINNRLLKENQCSVYWVTVSQVFTMNKLQSDIAKVIGLDFSEEDNEDKRAWRLNQALSQKDFVLILDNVWNDIDLEKMGDPLGVEGCKLIVTTRSLTVCCRIDCRETIKVETLQTDESLTLFRETLGERTAISSEVEEIAMSLAKECDGLPLGIIVLAKSMKGVTDIHEWRNVYDEICESPMELDDMKDKVFRVLEYSFNHLDPEFHGQRRRRRRRRRNGFTKLQLCFLYCSLYPEDHSIEKDKLIRKFISEELMDRRKSLEKQLDQGKTMLSKLENLCLLESVQNVMGLVSVRMHDLVRDMALKIARESLKYKVFAGLGLKKMPNEEEWTEDVNKISLIFNEIEEIPQGMAPNCPKLTTLLLNYNPLKSIPESFFAKMSGLRILDLSYTSIRELPNSLSDLESLNTLLLNNCRKLVSVPYLGKLKALRELDLSHSEIRELPNSLSDLESLNTLLLNDCINLVSVPYLGKLKALRKLDLSHSEIRELPNSLSDLESLNTLLLNDCINILSVPYLGNLKALRELDLSGTSIEEMPKGMKNLINLKILLFRCTKKLKLLPEDFSLISPYLQHLELPLEIAAPVHEIVKFKQLEKFVGNFKDSSDLNWFQSQTGGLISKFYYNLGSLDDEYNGHDPSLRTKKLSMEKCSLRRGEGEGEEGVIILPENIQELRIQKCKGQSSCILDDFKSFPSFLNKLRIVDCEGIESILTINEQLMAETVIFLEHTMFIGIIDCDELEELIQLNEQATDDDEDTSELTLSLPNLIALRLRDLPKLESICKVRINCESLEYIEIRECPRVKKLPLFLPSYSSSDGQVINYYPPPALKQISIDKQLWESLEWDDPTHKHLLQPFVEHFL